MANPNFTPTYSSNEIYRDLDMSQCLTDDLDTIESDITSLETGKANTNHTHTEYANASHSHSYNDLSNTPTIPTIPTSLPANGGNADTVDNKHAGDFAEVNHTHGASQVGYNGLNVGTFTKAAGASTLNMEIRYNDYKAVLYGTFVVANDLNSGTSVTLATNITNAVCPEAHYESCVSYFGNRALLVRITSGGELQVRNCGTTTLSSGSSITFRISYPIF